MRVHILGTRGYPSTYGGFETLVRHLAPDLVRRGHEVTVFDRGRPEGGGVERVVDGVRVHRSVGTGGTASSTLSHGLSSSLVTARERPDVALIMNVANGFFLPALRSRRVPTVLNVDGIEWERDKWSATGKWVFKTAARATARWADILVADSEAIRARWIEEFGRDSEFVPYGGDPGSDPPGPERLRPLGLRPGGYVLVVARLVPENNVLTMLEGALRTAAPVVVVGSGGGNETEARVRALHDPPRVHTLGHVADQELLHALWAHCGVYLHGHSVGGTNPALVQAMGLGAPVLAYDTVFSREVLAREEMLVPLDPDVIAERARGLLDSGADRARVAAWGRERVDAVYNWRAVCDGYETVLEKTAGLSRSVLAR